MSRSEKIIKITDPRFYEQKPDAPASGYFEIRDRLAKAHADMAQYYRNAVVMQFDNGNMNMASEMLESAAKHHREAVFYSRSTTDEF